MKISPEQMAQDHAQYAAAFGEDMAPQREQSEDEAFGITDAPHGEQPAGEAEAPAAETPAEQAGEPAGAEQAEAAATGADDTAASGEPAGQTEDEAAGDQPGAEDGQPRDGAEESAAGGADGAAAPEAEGGDKTIDIAKETQRLKSWEGRLRKLEEELKSGKPTTESPAVEALEDTGEQADAAGKPELAEAAEKAADAVEDGKMSVEQAMKQLAEDFGEDFVKMIETIAKHHATEAGTSAATSKVGEVKQAVDDIIAHISDSSARAHFKQIHDAHPDFMDIGKSDGFKQYIDALPEAEKAQAEQTVNTGSAEEIIKLLDAYKASQAKETPQEQQADEKQAAEPVVDPAVNAQMDAAEGVRSSGMALPEEPKPSSSYEDAWNEFSR